MSLIKTLVNGIFAANPVLRLAIGLVPALGITHLAINGVYIGVLTTIVLLAVVLVKIATNWFLSQDVQLFVDCASLAVFTTVLYRLMGMHQPDILVQLGIYFPLIALNGFILQRLFSDQKPLTRIVDALGMGIGYTLALTVIGIIREFVGLGQIFGISILHGSLAPFSLAATVPGGFIIIGLLIALLNALTGKEVKLHE